MPGKNFIQLLFFLPCFLIGQQPDFELKELFHRSYEEAVGPNAPTSANVSLYNDGFKLNVVIEVRDADVKISNLDDQCDQVHLWFALPESSYPANFDYKNHPDYILSSQYKSRGIEKTTSYLRFFSLDHKNQRSINVGSFIRDYDYPTPTKVDSFLVPPASQLMMEQVHWGMVQFSLFPDGRPARFTNKRAHALIESSLGEQLEDLSSFLKYTVDWMDEKEGYIINAEIKPEALGYLQVPVMNQIQFMVDLQDWSYQQQKLVSVMSSSPEMEAGYPESYSQVSFLEPLRTNMLGIPDDVFYKTQFYPTILNSRRGWKPVSIHSDALILKEHTFSRYIREIAFRKQNIFFETLLEDGIPYEKLILEMDFINEQDTRKEYILLGGHKFEVHSPIGKRFSGGGRKVNELFNYPDGAHGLILYNKSQVDQYGWGNCGSCLEEQINIYRVTDDEKTRILSIQQGEGSEPYCQIGDVALNEFYITQLDWIEKGKVLVMRLDNWYNPTLKKRVKVSWDKRGNNVEIEPF
ncbi:MAG: hypothetical protein AAGC85_10750 [Bacteroidota bacterium]